MLEADGFNSKDSKIAGWGWYVNVWSGDARNWNKRSTAYRLMHLNPRPRGGVVVMNHCLRTGWGPEKDLRVPDPWRLENADRAFKLELELGDRSWTFKLNDIVRPEMTYDRQGDFSQPLTL